MSIELGLGDPDGGVEIFVRQRRVDDFTAVLCQEGRFDAARDRLPTAEEDDSHLEALSLSLAKRGLAWPSFANGT
jgi:hypothetical protein